MLLILHAGIRATGHALSVRRHGLAGIGQPRRCESGAGTDSALAAKPSGCARSAMGDLRRRKKLAGKFANRPPIASPRARSFLRLAAPGLRVAPRERGRWE